MKESWYLRYLAARTALLSVEIAATSGRTNHLCGLCQHCHGRGYPDLWFSGSAGPDFRHADTDCGLDRARAYGVRCQLFPAGNLKGLAS